MVRKEQWLFRSLPSQDVGKKNLCLFSLSVVSSIQMYWPVQGQPLGKTCSISMVVKYVCLDLVIDANTRLCLYIPLLTIPIFPLSISLEEVSTTTGSPIVLITSIPEFGLYLYKHGIEIEGIERCPGSSCFALTILLLACANPKAPWLYFQICANPIVLFM